jgi:hypothetical protein
MKQTAVLADYRRKHLPSFDKHAHSYIGLITPQNHNQHPEGPYNSSRSYKELWTVIWSLHSLFWISDKMFFVLRALLDSQGKSGQLNISDEKLAKKAGMSQQTLRRILQRLEDGKVIQRLHYMPTKTSYRRQINVCWDSLMIPHPLKMSGNLILSSVFSSSSLKDLKDTKYSLSGACPSDKQLASSEPEAPRLPIPSQDILDDKVDNRVNKVDKDAIPESFKSQVSSFLGYKSPVIENIPAAQVVVLKDYGPPQEQNMNKSPVLAMIDKLKKEKEDRERDERERITAREATIARRDKSQKEDASVFTKRRARQERLSQLETLYPDWQEVCDREGCDINILKQRMWENTLYDPFTCDTSSFNPFCHARYGFMSEEEKDKEFIRTVNTWIYPKPYRHSARNIQIFKRARIRADCLRCLYSDYIVAIYWGVGERNMRYTHINSKYAEAYYDRWINAGKPIPRNTGESKESNLQFERLKVWKSSAPKWKRRDSYQLLSERVDPIIRSFTAEYVRQITHKKEMVG